MSKNYDLLIIGGGKAGKSMAMLQAAKGWSVAMVEPKFIGGTCINVACIPTKTLITSARTLRRWQAAAAIGLEACASTADVESLRGRKDSLIGALVKAHRDMFDTSPMDFFEGTAAFIDPHTVTITLVDGEEFTATADRIIINTGSRPARPSIPGLWEAGAWTSEDILRMEFLPQRLGIIGGGYIGIEFAQMMRDFGVKVTLLNRGEMLLEREDAWVSAAMNDALVSDGVEVIHGVSVTSAKRNANGEIICHTDTQGDLVFDAVLVAAGRTPNSDTLAIENSGVTVSERGFIVVDDAMRTNVTHIWAAGDVAGSPMFTHASWHDYRVIRAQFDGVEAKSGEATTKGRLMPSVLFGTPELARIGLNEKEAAAAGREVLIAQVPTMAIPRAKTLGQVQGMWKAIVDAETHQVLGATLMGVESGEVITALHMAMAAGMTYEQIRFQAIAHPTMGEGLNLLFDSLP